VFDVLFRVLQRRHGEVAYARNVTDVDDKIIAAAREQGVPTEAIALRYTQAYHEDMAALGVLPPTIEPHATRHIPEMLAMIGRLIEQGHAYEAEGHVLFHVPSFADYGRLSRRSREEMIDGARVEVAPYKRDPADFVLWKPSTPEQPGWDSPWGRGRPGWHIECSAMALAHLGVTIDIHGGGQDLKFPHHENEIAQSVCTHEGAPLARFWLHNGFLDIEKEKMSKSLGNVLLVLYLTLSELAGPDEAEESGAPQGVIDALEDDLNTPKAFADLFALAHQANASADQAERRALKGQILAGGRLLGLLQQSPQAWLKEAAGSTSLDAAEIERLIEARAEARRTRDFAEADRIRDQLAAEGVIIEDLPGRTRWRLAG
jgi:cysteinyl-tRNA synthetase